MHHSRLARAAERQQLAIPPSALSFPNKQARPRQMQVGLEQLVPALMSSGVKPGIKIGGNAEEKAMVIIATLGELEIPLTFVGDAAKAIRDAVNAAYDRIATPDAPALESTDPDRDAELLAEATTNLKGDYDDTDDDADLGYVVAAEACTDA